MLGFVVVFFFFLNEESGKYKGQAIKKSVDFSLIAFGVGEAGWEMMGRKREKLVDTKKDSPPDQS